MTSLEGKILSDRYRLEKALGTGGMGTVYCAEHTLMRKRVAIKVLHQEMSSLAGAVERFEREAIAAAHIEHPNVAAATDYGKLDDGTFFLVLEYVEGASLRDSLDGNPLEVRRAVHVAKQIASALVRAHSLGIVHRDLKPENVMLVDRDGDPDFVKVLDFGIAKVPVGDISRTGKQIQALTKAGMIFGTPEYMAPEQALGQEVDSRADLYALGVMLYEMLVGQRPFAAENAVMMLGMQITQPPPAFAEIAPDLELPAEVETLVMQLLEKEAARRPESTKHVRDSLEQIDSMLGYMVGGIPGSNTGGVPSVVPTLVSGSQALSKAPPSRGIPASAAVRARVPSAKPPPSRSHPPSQSHRPSQSHPPNEPYDTLASLTEQSETVSELFVPIKRQVERIPGGTSTLVGAVLAGAVIAIVVAVTALSSGKVEQAIPSLDRLAPASSAALNSLLSVPDPDRPEFESKEHADALESLFRQFPSNPELVQRVAEMRLQGATPESSVEVYRKLFELSPNKMQDEAVVARLIEAVKSKVSRDAAFDVLTNLMGTVGPDIIYDVVFIKPPKGLDLTRGYKAIKSDEFRLAASSALLAAVDLRFAATCDQKKSALGAAGEHGDDRALRLLVMLRNNTGCGKKGGLDCWKCMRDGTLEAAIGAVSKRLDKGP
ncbi:MAG: serine/threonine protein kinase [Polyangiaceae bacterium]|nr:serine/threonine protein kinase [Polyangiaceae bacterium]